MPGTPAGLEPAHRTSLPDAFAHDAADLGQHLGRTPIVPKSNQHRIDLNQAARPNQDFLQPFGTAAAKRQMQRSILGISPFKRGWPQFALQCGKGIGLVFRIVLQGRNPKRVARIDFSGGLEPCHLFKRIDPPMVRSMQRLGKYRPIFGRFCHRKIVRLPLFGQHPHSTQLEIGRCLERGGHHRIRPVFGGFDGQDKLLQRGQSRATQYLPAVFGGPDPLRKRIAMNPLPVDVQREGGISNLDISAPAKRIVRSGGRMLNRRSRGLDGGRQCRAECCGEETN